MERFGHDQDAEVSEEYLVYVFLYYDSDLLSISKGGGN
jgi:hypothetical protein